MPDVAAIVQAGSAHAWLYLPIAVVLGERPAPAFDRLAQRLPYLSAGLVMLMGLILTAAGLGGTGLLSARRPH